jgi:hypothetical protein
MTFKPATWPRKLRSQEWYRRNRRDQIYHRGWMKNQGYPHDMFDGRPVIGISTPGLNSRLATATCANWLKVKARRLGGGRLSGRSPGVLGLREHLPSDRHDVPQPRSTCGRGEPFAASRSMVRC